MAELNVPLLALALAVDGDFEDFPLQLDELRRRKKENPLKDVGVSGGCRGASEK